MKITGKRIIELLGEKNQTKFVNAFFDPLKLEGKPDAIDSWPVLGKQRRYAFLSGKEANSRKTLERWAEIINQADIIKQLEEKIAAYQSDNEEQRRDFREMFEEDKSDKNMPRKLANKIERNFAQNQDSKAILLLFLWSIFRENISLLSFLYANEEIPAPLHQGSQEEAHLIPHMISASPIYIRHSDLIEKIHTKLTQNNHYVFLQGMGGVGKTESAKQYAIQFADQYDTIVFAEYNSSLLDLLNDNTVFTLTKPFQPERFRNLNGITETDEEFYQRKLAVLRCAVNERTLIILDNVDTQDAKLEDFLSCVCHVIITTRWQSQTIYPDATIPLDEINTPQESMEIFSAHYGKNMQNDPFVEKIIEHFSGHTLALELTAKQMKASNLSAEEMWDIIDAQNENELEDGFILPNKGRTERSMSSHIQQVFTIANLNENDRYILSCLALMPKRGLDKKNVRDFCGQKNYNQLNNLIQRSWLRELDGVISMHTLIKETILISCKPDLLSCKQFIDRMLKELSARHCFWATYHEKIEIYNIAAHLYDIFPVPTMESSNFYEWAELVFSHCHQPQKAMTLAQDTRQLYLDHYGEEHFKTIRMLCRIGCDDRNCNYIEHAYAILDKGREMLLRLAEKDSKQFMYLSDVDLVMSDMVIVIYRKNGDAKMLEKAEILCKEIIDIRSSLYISDPDVDRNYKNCLIPYRDLARIHILRNDIPGATRFLQLTDEEYQQYGMGYDLYYLDIGKAELAIAENRTEDAISYILEALNCRKQYYGEWYSGDTTSHVINLKVQLGILYGQVGEYQKAMDTLHSVQDTIKMHSFYHAEYLQVCELISNLERKLKHKAK